MPSAQPANSSDFFLRLSGYFAKTVLIIAVSVLLGWQFDIGILKSIFPGLVPMSRLNAGCFFLAGTALLLHLSKKEARKRAGLWLGYAVCLLGVVKIVFYQTIDDFTVRTWGPVGSFFSTMAPHSAIGFILTGAATGMLDHETSGGKRISEYLALAALFLSLLSFIGYIYHAPVFYSPGDFVPMAFSTSVAFLLLAHAILFAYPTKGLMADVTSNNAGGIMARKILPAIMTFPILLGLLRLAGEWNGLYDEKAGVAAYTISIILLFVIATWYAVHPLNRADIALKTANKRLKERTSQLEEINKELESFTYSVSHDLRAPLRSINGYAKILAEDYAPALDDEGKNIVRIVVKNAEKMGMLIDDLLDFSRLGRKEISKANINMTQLAKRVAQEQLHSKPDYDIITVEQMPDALGDYSLISQVYQNLISNAIKYSSRKEAPEIRVGSFRNDRNEVVYFIRDNGAGFDMRYYNKLFGVFQRLHHDTEFAGTGVGLAIVKRIISKHGGEIWAEGKLREGAVFFFTLPER